MKLELNPDATCIHDAFVGVEASKIAEIVDNTIKEFIAKADRNENFNFGDILQKAALEVETPGELCLLTLELGSWWQQAQQRLADENNLKQQVRDQLSELFKDEEIPKELKNSGIMVAGLGGSLRSLMEILEDDKDEKNDPE